MDTMETEETLHEISCEIGVIRTCLDDFVTGFKTGDNAQANQTKTLRRMHNSMERLASIGQSASMPDVVNDIFERSDRPTASITMAPAASDRYDAFGSGLDAHDPSVAALYESAKKVEEAAQVKRQRVRSAAQLIKKGLSKNFPSSLDVASKRRKSGAAAHRVGDALLKPDFQVTVKVPKAGKVAKMHKVGATVRKGAVLAYITPPQQPQAQAASGAQQQQQQQQQQQIVVTSPSDGTVKEIHVKEGDIVEADAPMLTVQSNTLSSYVSELRNIPHTSCQFERIVPGMAGSSPSRIVLAVGVQGVLTCRLALSRYSLDQDDSPDAGAGGAGARGDGGDAAAAGGDEDAKTKTGDVVMSTEGGELGGKEGRARGSIIIEIDGLSVSGVTENINPYESSSLAVFRSISNEAMSALHTLRRTSPPEEVLTSFIAWLSNYRSLFSAKCIYCKKILAADSSTAPHEDWASNGPQHTYIPPTGRDLKTGKAFHSQCCPVGEAT